MRKDVVIVLPNRDEMLARLVKVSTDTYLQEHFYPLLLRSAGQEVSPPGMVAVLMTAFVDYLENKSAVLGPVLQMQFPKFIDALGDDPKFAQQAKDFLKSATATK